MTPTRTAESFALLEEITATAGLPSAGASPIRLAENDLWRLPGQIVVRIARAGQDGASAREVAVARWLLQHRVPAVRPIAMDQPIVVGGRSATFWEELPPHKAGRESDLAPLLRQLHELPKPPFAIGEMDPFIRIRYRLIEARVIAETDRSWLLGQLDELGEAWSNLPEGRPSCVIHGDAWGGNCAVTAEGAVLLDFERASLGRPEWDLTSTAVAVDTFGSLSRESYKRFCDAYGYDVMAWPGYPVLRAIRELRLVTFALQVANDTSETAEQAQYRLACIRGTRGPRPWGWTAVG
ncbi:phosphotransferase family protein [Streptomyces paromomycinus]|uniref:Aminoglycoside phosphotransferase n=1 Tax=Streptomyces paromomycinus TaxID=92743 RepID=A0A401VXI0_STREY|nr:aminoglycoside phosphotransferase family protein [Streptomyces paromomycinus]GCD41772.1 aminoglycoside phosphotransferase [Streptomyces paromomycinus]